VGSTIRYLDMSGTEVQLVRENIHHRNETVSGLGDPMLLGSTSLALRGWRVTARAGLTIPIGGTEENPFALGDMGLRHQHIQMGTGTVNPVVAAEVARSWSRWRFGVFALSQQVVYENGKGYQAGDRYAGGVVLGRSIGSRWHVRGGIDALGETAERWDGMAPIDDGNRGRFDLIFGAGASFAVSPQVGIEVGLKIPAVTHAVGGQLRMPAIFDVGASWSFGGRPAPAPHKHDHGDDEHGEHAHDGEGHGEDHTRAVPADTGGLDVGDLGKPGEAVELVPVPGKVTIFDFWAEWCQPCKVLEPALVEIARAHPDLVAIRRIDAVDWDSAAVAKHLAPKAYGLPHLKVFDRSGRMVIERSSEPGKLEALIADVRALVEAEATKRAR
jgi:thiol-disulfide isomerase/thioredoxin